MADKKQLARLKKGVKAWNAWRKKNPTIEIDLSGARLSRANLSGAHLNKANLNRTNLREADLSGANLTEANLFDADLGWVIFIGADLSGANLIQADLSGANLSTAILNEATLRAAILSEANLSATILNETDLRETTVMGTSFDNVDLSKARGLETIVHEYHSSIGIDTIYKSKGNIPEVFLRGCGVPEDMIEYIRLLRGKAFGFYSCFISHSTKDRKFRERLLGDLRAKGVRTWYFHEDAKWGETVWGEIDRSIKTYDKLVVVLSEHSLQSEPVLREIQRSLDREDKEQKNILFPIRIDDYVFAKWEHERKADVVEKVVGDFSGWDKDAAKYDKAFEKLLRGLQA